MPTLALLKRLMHHSPAKPIAKAYLAPLGGTANPDRPAVNPLMVAGLFVS